MKRAQLWTPEEILLSAANFTSNLGQHETFAKLITLALKMCGLSLVTYIDEEDNSGLFIPVGVFVHGKWEHGCILTLQDRAVIAWWTGVFRIKHFFQVVPYETITGVSTGEIIPATKLKPEKVTLEIEAERDVVIRLMRLTEGADIPFMVESVLLGAMTFDKRTVEELAEAE